MSKPPVRILAIALVTLVVAGGVWWWTHRAPTNTDLVMQGNVEIRQVNLGFKVAGRVKTLDVDEGDSVVAGQRLASLDKVYFTDAIAQLKAQRDQQKANVEKMVAGYRVEEIAQAAATVAERDAALENAMIALERADRLLKSGTGTQKTYDDAVAAKRQAVAQLNSARQNLALMNAGYRREDIEAARAQLASSEAALQIAERQLIDSELYAAGDGIVLTRVREAGAIVNGGDTVFVLSLTSPVWIRTYVAETELGRIRPGQDVTIRTDTPSNGIITGRVGFISPTAEFTPKTVETRELRTALVYRVRIVASDTAGVLRQGMPATVTVLPINTAAAAQDRQTEGQVK